MLQMRFSPDGKWYSPARDLAYIFDFFVKWAVEAAHPDAHSPLTKKLVSALDVSVDDLREACQKLVDFCALLYQHPDWSLEKLLKESGFESVPDGAKAVVVYLLGRCLIGVAYTSVRQANTPDNQIGGEWLNEAAESAKKM